MKSSGTENLPPLPDVPDPPLDCSRNEFLVFVHSLKDGERVIERGESGMKGQTGTVEIRGDEVCIRWDTKFDQPGTMVTSFTGGARRLIEAVREPVAKPADEIPKGGMRFRMLFEGEWQDAVEITGESHNKRWFRGELIGAVPIDEIQGWEPVGKPYGCKCQTLAGKLLGDGCDECNPELAAEMAANEEDDEEEQAPAGVGGLKWRESPPDSPGWWARHIGRYQQIYWINDGESYGWPEKGLWAGPIPLEPLPQPPTPDQP